MPPASRERPVLLGRGEAYSTAIFFGRIDSDHPCERYGLPAWPASRNAALLTSLDPADNMPWNTDAAATFFEEVKIAFRVRLAVGFGGEFDTGVATAFGRGVKPIGGEGD